MRFAPVFTFFTVLLVVFGTPAYAITNGTADGDGHPPVGALIAGHPYSDGTWAYCTGTLISPTVLVTAAHCGHRGQKTARITFAAHYRKGDALYTGRYVVDPSYRSDRDLHDIAVVLFDAPVPGIKPATLPPAGLLSTLEATGALQRDIFTPVGYGSLAPVKGAHRKDEFVYTDTRNRTSISYEGLTRNWLKLSENPYRHDGGTCYGDSGGPNFLGDSDLLVATTISGDDDACKATNYDYRLDAPLARAFLGRFVTLP